MEGFITKDGYAAVPYGKSLMIIYNNEQLDVVRSVKKANEFIENHRTPAPKKPRKRTE